MMSFQKIYKKSHPARGAWIEINSFCNILNGAGGSHPARGAWIEIRTMEQIKTRIEVAPRKGCVD